MLIVDYIDFIIFDKILQDRMRYVLIVLDNVFKDNIMLSFTI